MCSIQSRHFLQWKRIPKHKSHIVNVRFCATSNKWGDLNFVREYLEKLKSHYCITDDEWHLITSKQIREFKGGRLLNRYKSLTNVLHLVYPKVKVTNKRKHDWKNMEHVKEYLHNLRLHYNLGEDDWHMITTKHIKDFGGCGLLTRYKTLGNALKVAFPGIQTRIPVQQKWDDLEFVRDYLQRLRAHYRRTENEWHLITVQQIRSFNGSRLIGKYKTLQNALQLAYPGSSFPRARVFSGRPHHYWNDEENVKKFIKAVEETLHMRNPQDWYRVSIAMLQRLGGPGLINRSRTYTSILKMCYPHIKWDEKLIKNPRKKSEQFYLRSILQKMYPHSEIIEDYLHPNLIFDSGQPMEIDLFIPEKKLGIEYQGEHHFEDSPHFGPLELYAQRDREKLKKCHEIGLQLAIIPFKWGRSEKDLRERITAQCII